MTTDTLDSVESAPGDTRAAPAPDERAKERKQAPLKVASPLAGTLWIAGWLFTIGLAKLVWWKALLGLLVWPYYLGAFLR